MTTTELYSWLGSFINMEKGLGGKPSSAREEHFKLERMMMLSSLAEKPELSAPVIHVAGSKGKGSVTAMIASILENAGIKTARYMSPHVSDWRERISRGNGSFFPETTYTKAGEELKKIHAAYNGDSTFFELMTLLFFLCAKLENCKAMVVETGLGGRLDATNIVEPVVSVITVIEKEHTEYLGDTLSKIAREKAGIIKKNRPVVSAKQEPDVLLTLQQKAQEMNAPFFYITESVHIPGMKLQGSVYEYNAALAVQAVRLAFPAVIDEARIKNGLSDITLPARFETIRISPPFVIDGAHTPLSIRFCVETFCRLYGNNGILIFGCASDKDSFAMAEILFPNFCHCIITATGKFRSSKPAAVYKAFCSVRKKKKAAGIDFKHSLSICCMPDTATAIDEAVRLSNEKNLPVLGCGSFYLAAEIRNAMMIP